MKGFEYAPIGSFREDSNGYIRIKVANRKWMLYHRYLWEKHYNKKLPQDMIIVFLDGNRRNFNIENLAAITRAEHLYITDHRLRFSDAQLSKTGTLIAKVAVKAKEKSRNVKKKVTVYLDDGHTAVAHDCTLQQFIDSLKKTRFKQFMVANNAMLNVDHVVKVVEEDE